MDLSPIRNAVLLCRGTETSQIVTIGADSCKLAWQQNKLCRSGGQAGITQRGGTESCLLLRVQKATSKTLEGFLSDLPELLGLVGGNERVDFSQHLCQSNHAEPKLISNLS